MLKTWLSSISAIALVLVPMVAFANGNEATVDTGTTAWMLTSTAI